MAYFVQRIAELKHSLREKEDVEAQLHEKTDAVAELEMQLTRAQVCIRSTAAVYWHTVTAGPHVIKTLTMGLSIKYVAIDHL